LEHSESKVIFLGKLDDYRSQQSGIPAAIQRISFETYGIKEGEQWEKLIQEDSITEFPPVKPADLATIMYTSGTTGTPKGVMIDFKSFHFVIETALDEIGVRRTGQRYFSYLPLSHIAERLLVEMGGLYSGASISFPESLEKFPQNLMDTQPTIFLAVPRIWAKFQEKILLKLPQKKLSTLLSIPLISGLIKKSIHKKLGLSQAEFIFSGAAPIPESLLVWYKQLGINIQEAYAMTENTCLSHHNHRDRIRIGSVGQPFSCVEVKLGEDDEILIKHEALMLGYYKQPELTASVLIDGYLHTGDKGEIDSEGYLKITGRIKDLFKTDKGKYIAPSKIEKELAINTDIEQVCVVGMGIPQPIALIVLSETGKAKSENEIIESLGTTVMALNQKLQSYERIETAVIMKDDWTIENQLMTPSLKVRRGEVEKIHVPNYPMWYKKEGLVVWE
jgi:long-chain acyl-CoA synthetase